MSNDKLGGKPQIRERKDIQERDDEIMNEEGIGPGSGAQTAQHQGELSEKQTTQKQSRKEDHVKTPRTTPHRKG